MKFLKTEHIRHKIGYLLGKIEFAISNTKQGTKTSLIWWSEIKEKLKTPALNNYKLGMENLRNGNLKSAILRFKLCLKMEKDFEHAHFYLGLSYFISGKEDQAKEHLKLEPNSHLTEYFLKLAEKQDPPHLTGEIVKLYFSILENNFDDDFIEATENYAFYDILEELEKIIDGERNKNKNFKILDLGCGNGFFGKRIREKIANIEFLDGLDFSDHLINLAKEQFIGEENDKFYIYRNLYDEEIKGFKEEIKYDIIVTRGIFNYLENIDEIFANLSKAIEKNGYLLFYLRNEQTELQDAEIIQKSYPFYIKPFIHEDTELRAIINKYNFILVKQENIGIDIYNDGSLIILKKK